MLPALTERHDRVLLSIIRSRMITGLPIPAIDAALAERATRRTCDLGSPIDHAALAERGNGVIGQAKLFA